MLAARLRARCGSSRRVGVTEAVGFDIDFDKIGQDGSGKATLVAAPGHSVPGVLYELDADDLGVLDQIEGVGRGCDRIALDLDGQQALAYIAPPAFRDPVMRPFDWYLALVLAGAAEAGLPAQWIRLLAAQASISDPEPDRPRRIEALALLATGAGLRDMQGNAGLPATD